MLTYKRLKRKIQAVKMTYVRRAIGVGKKDEPMNTYIRKT